MTLPDKFRYLDANAAAYGRTSTRPSVGVGGISFHIVGLVTPRPGNRPPATSPRPSFGPRPPRSLHKPAASGVRTHAPRSSALPTIISWQPAIFRRWIGSPASGPGSGSRRRLPTFLCLGIAARRGAARDLLRRRAHRRLRMSEKPACISCGRMAHVTRGRDRALDSSVRRRACPCRSKWRCRHQTSDEAKAVLRAEGRELPEAVTGEYDGVELFAARPRSAAPFTRMPGIT